MRTVPHMSCFRFRAGIWKTCPKEGGESNLCARVGRFFGRKPNKLRGTKNGDFFTRNEAVGGSFKRHFRGSKTLSENEKNTSDFSGDWRSTVLGTVWVSLRGRHTPGVYHHTYHHHFAAHRLLSSTSRHSIAGCVKAVFEKHVK